MAGIINSVVTNLAPETLAGNAALALALIPVQFVVDATKEKIKCYIEKVLPYYPEEIYYNALISTLQEHKKRYDNVAGIVATRLIRKLKKDKDRFCNCVNTSQIPDEIIRSNDPFPTELFAEKLFAMYSIGSDESEKELILNVLKDCMGNYRRTLLREMNEKGLLLQTLQILINIQNRQAFFETLLADVATKSDLLILKNAILTALRHEDKTDWQGKTLDEYDTMIAGLYQNLEFTAGFSPRINAREISMKMSDAFVNLSYVSSQTIRSEKWAVRDFDLSEAVMHSRFNVFLGDPGSGKTTLLKKIAIDLVSSKNRAKGALSGFIPLYFRLADYSRFYQSTRQGIAEFLQHTYYQYQKSLFETARTEKSLVFLMDGLDEVADTPLRIQVVEQVNSFVFANPQFIYFITSRIVGYRDAALNGIFSTYRLEPLSDKKIEAFIKQWHLTVEKNTDDNKTKEEKEAIAEEKTKKLVDAIGRNASVKRLATNPLLLTIITLIHLQGGRLPNKRVQLYEICADTFLQHWINLRVESEDAILDRDILIELLSRIAFYIHENYADGLIPENDFQKKFLEYYRDLSGDGIRSTQDLNKECRQFIDFIRKETGIFAEKGQDENGQNLFGFLHLTFEEYFAAIEFKRRIAQNGLRLKDYIPSARWREIILLCAALFGGQPGTGRRDASNFVNRVLRAQELFPPLHQNLSLVLSIMADDVRLESKSVDEIWSRLENVLQIDDDFDLFEELNALNTSTVYKDALYIKIGQWLNHEGAMFSNTVQMLLRLPNEDQSGEYLAQIPFMKGFDEFLVRTCSYDSYWKFIRKPEIKEQWMESVINYVNKQTVHDKTRWELLTQLLFRHDITEPKLYDKLTLPQDKLTVRVCEFVEFVFHNIANYKINIVEWINNQLNDKYPDLINPRPSIIVHHETNLSSEWRLSRGRLSYQVVHSPQGIELYYFISAIGNPKFYLYIVIDAFLKKIQFASFEKPLTPDEYIGVFGFEGTSIQNDNEFLYSYMPMEKNFSVEQLLSFLKNSNLYLWLDLLSADMNDDEENSYVSGVRKWMQTDDQKNPLQILLAQMILSKYRPERNHLTRKAIQEAATYYMQGYISENQKHDAYKIIRQAIQTLVPSGTSKQ